jgi:hypothetical protein
MKTFVLIAALAMSLPGIADARKVTYYSDRDRDGHYVKRTKNVPDYGYRGGYYGGRGYYGNRYSGGRYYGGRSYYGGYRPYYGRSYYSSYRPYYGRSYYSGYPYYYGSPGISFVYSSSSPRYYSYDRSYRSSYSSLEVDVQRALKRRGYYYGPIDGDIGPGSRNAIRSYQADRGLSVTGRIDSRLLRSLGI